LVSINKMTPANKV